MEVLVNIDVRDLDEAIAFYEAALPLRLGRRLFDGEVAELIGASARIYLLQNPAGTSATAGGQATRDYGRHWTPVHMDFAVDDIELAHARAVAAGARPEGTVQAFAWGRLATLSDPFGNGFCLVEFPGAPYDGAGL